MRSTGSRLLFDVNLQLRFGHQWDPGNFMELLEFCTNESICDIDWELGNGWCLSVIGIVIYVCLSAKGRPSANVCI